jgi:hypothetical protein
MEKREIYSEQPELEQWHLLEIYSYPNNIRKYFKSNNIVKVNIKLIKKFKVKLIKKFNIVFPVNSNQDYYLLEMFFIFYFQFLLIYLLTYKIVHLFL